MNDRFAELKRLERERGLGISETAVYQTLRYAAKGEVPDETLKKDAAWIAECSRSVGPLLEENARLTAALERIGLAIATEQMNDEEVLAAIDAALGREKV